MNEITALRKTNSKTYDLGGGKRRVVESLRPVHYESGGQMLEYAPVWTRSGSDWSLAGMPFTLSFNTGQKSYTYSSAAGDVTVELISMGGSLPAMDFTNFVNDSNRLGFFDIVPELDMYFVASYRGIHLHKILKGDLAPREFVWRVTKNTDANININVESRGAENINKVAQRETVRDTNRTLEFSDSFVLTRTQGKREIYEHTQRWTGRVRKFDAQTRQASWSTDFLYPVRIV